MEYGDAIKLASRSGPLYVVRNTVKEKYRAVLSNKRLILYQKPAEQAGNYFSKNADVIPLEGEHLSSCVKCDKKDPEKFTLIITTTTKGNMTRNKIVVCLTIFAGFEIVNINLIHHCVNFSFIPNINL